LCLYDNISKCWLYFRKEMADLSVCLIGFLQFVERVQGCVDMDAFKEGLEINMKAVIVKHVDWYEDM